MSIAQTLGKCADVLQMLSESSNSSKRCAEKYSVDNEGFDKTERSSGEDDDQDGEKKKQKLLTLLEERLQHNLKCMIKLAIAKTSK